MPSDSITFHGRLGKHRVAEHMRRADLLILPSRFESASCVLIEAMACGLPVLASAVGGVPEIVDTTSGRLVQPNDVADLSQQLISMLQSLDTYDRKAIVRRAERYSPWVVGSQLDLAYRSALEWRG